MTKEFIAWVENHITHQTSALELLQYWSGWSDAADTDMCAYIKGITPYCMGWNAYIKAYRDTHP